MSGTHQKRMRDLGRLPRFKSERDDPLLNIHLDRIRQMDLRMKEDFQRASHFLMARMESGSGLRMPNILRYFFQEYNTRFVQGGPEWLPSSFNVLEAFFPFRRDLFLFDMAEEEDYIFRLLDYMDWYTKGGLPEEFQLVADSLREGIIHSYTVIGDAESFLVTGKEIDFRIAGISMIRHGSEIVAMLLAGQREKDATVSSQNTRLLSASELSGYSPPEKEGLRPLENPAADEHLLEGATDFERVIVATRINAARATHDVRYILIDRGPSFQVLTDDFRVLESLPSSMREKARAATKEQFHNYASIYSAALSLIYLPTYFGENSQWTVRNEVATPLRSDRQKKNVRAALQEFGPEVVKFERSVASMPQWRHNRRSIPKQIEAPELQFSSRGYWKAIGPDEIGEDSDGKPVFGKTWVHVQDSWVQVPAEKVFAAKTQLPKESPDPGYIYVMRSPSHGSNIFKVGLTRRSVSDRAQDLTSATSAPTQFLELASWQVGDCGAVERAVHVELEFCRINKRREFFRAPLGQIVNTIERVVSELSSVS